MNLTAVTQDSCRLRNARHGCVQGHVTAWWSDITYCPHREHNWQYKAVQIIHKYTIFTCTVVQDQVCKMGWFVFFVGHSGQHMNVRILLGRKTQRQYRVQIDFSFSAALYFTNLKCVDKRQRTKTTLLKKNAQSHIGDLTHPCSAVWWSTLMSWEVEGWAPADVAGMFDVHHSLGQSVLSYNQCRLDVSFFVFLSVAQRSSGRRVKRILLFFCCCFFCRTEFTIE